MPKKTLYVRDADLPIWEAAERRIGEKSMSTFVINALREKLEMREGFLHILGSQAVRQTGLGRFMVSFAPTQGPGGALKANHVADIAALTRLLTGLGLTERAIAETIADLEKQGWKSILMCLPEDKIAMLS